MHFYKNGNYIVCIMDDGTKIRKSDDSVFIPSFAECVDLCITKSCTLGCKFCLTEDTLIDTPNGMRKITEIQKGDMVYSFNQLNYEFQLKPVDMLFCREYVGDLIEIKLKNGKKLKCTPNHKVYTTNRGWVEAALLTKNDDILTF